MNSSKNKQIGRRIKNIREDLGISQTKLGDLIGVSYQQIQKYENGTSSLSVEKLSKIATVLRIPVSFFFEDYKKEGYGRAKEESKKYLPDFLGAGKLNSDEKMLLKGYRSIKSKQLKKGLLLILKDLSNAN